MSMDAKMWHDFCIKNSASRRKIADA